MTQVFKQSQEYKFLTLLTQFQFRSNYILISLTHKNIENSNVNPLTLRLK